LIDSYVSEVEHTKSECLQLLKDVRAASSSEGETHHSTFRLIATPMLYSAWERCFTLCHAIALRLMREATPSPSSLGVQARAVWLMRTTFYQSLMGKLQHLGSAESETRVKRGQFPALCGFLKEFDKWSKEPLDRNIETDELVMTFSNVNQSVVQLNADAIGLSDISQFKALSFARLDELVGRRNDIGHGAIIKPPGEKDFLELWDFTEVLIGGYCDAVVVWMKQVI